MIDSHAHLSYEASNSSVGKILEKFKQLGGKYVFDIATGKIVLEKCLISQNNYSDIVKLSYGVHPERGHQSENNEEIYIEPLLAELSEMESIVNEVKVTPIAIGETGYDFYRTDKEETPLIELETQLFEAHLSLGKKLSLPIIIHARGRTNNDYSMHYKALETINKNGFQIPYYFHSFAGDDALLKAILDVNAYVGINGVISYQNVTDLRASIKNIPLNKMLLETDAPFLIPSNLDRGLLEEKTRNEPLAILYTAKIIAKLLNVSPEKIIEVTTDNAIRLYKL